MGPKLLFADAISHDSTFSKVKKLWSFCSSKNSDTSPSSYSRMSSPWKLVYVDLKYYLKDFDIKFKWIIIEQEKIVEHNEKEPNDMGIIFKKRIDDIDKKDSMKPQRKNPSTLQCGCSD